jgi:hypothetical protein
VDYSGRVKFHRALAHERFIDRSGPNAAGAVGGARVWEPDDSVTADDDQQ